MKTKDYKILTELRKNSRVQLKEISKNTSIPISTIYDRMQNNYKDIVKKHTTIVNFEEIGYNARASICLKCNKKNKKELYTFLTKHQNINSLYKINNGYDYMVETIFKNIKELEEFIEKIEDEYGIRSKEVFYIIDEVIKEKFLTNENFF